MPYIAGDFTAKYSSNSSSPSYTTIGSTENGFTLHVRFHGEDVKDDAFGDARPDRILQGVDYSVSGVMIEMDKLATAGALWAQEAEGAVNANVGHRASDHYGVLQLTPKPGTPAATQLGVGNSYFFWLAGVANDVEILRGSKLTKVPVTWECLPSPANSGKAYTIASTV